MGENTSGTERVALDRTEREEKKNIEHPCEGCTSKTIGGIRPCLPMGYNLYVEHCREIQRLPKIKAWLVILGGAKIVKSEK